MARLCEGRVVIVTGAGRGLGRAHALELARWGARVVVNDLGLTVEGASGSSAPADEVVAEIQAGGGEAVTSYHDVTDWDAAHELVATAVAAFGRLDVLVNNAGVLRRQMLTEMDEATWDLMMASHLKGTFCPTSAAVAHWRSGHEQGEAVDAVVVCTTSQSGLYGMPGFSGYAAAKAGVAGFVMVAARELEPYGVRVNAIAPRAHTRMADLLDVPRSAIVDGGFDPRAPENVSPLVAWLASSESAGVTGRVFEMGGDEVSVVEGWRRGPTAARGRRWDADELGSVVDDLLARAEPPPPIPVLSIPGVAR